MKTNKSTHFQMETDTIRWKSDIRPIREKTKIHYSNRNRKLIFHYFITVFP